jgi:hypothetical protein
MCKKNCYILTHPISSDIDFYYNCFLNENFYYNYNASFLKNDFESKVYDIAFEPYKGISRFIIKLNQKPISFANFLKNGNYSFVSGGISSEYFNTGKGLISACIFYDYYIKHFSVESLRVCIRRENLCSLRMHKSMGFEVIDGKEIITLKLYCQSFPNDLIKKILFKIQYEKR